MQDLSLGADIALVLCNFSQSDYSCSHQEIMCFFAGASHSCRKAILVKFVHEIASQKCQTANKTHSLVSIANIYLNLALCVPHYRTHYIYNINTLSSLLPPAATAMGVTSSTASSTTIPCWAYNSGIVCCIVLQCVVVCCRVSWTLKRFAKFQIHNDEIQVHKKNTAVLTLFISLILTRMIFFG